jgi:hypothetical protein
LGGWVGIFGGGGFGVVFGVVALVIFGFVGVGLWL